MPNRIIREGITTSEPLALVTFEAECLFYRLMVVADDFGAFDGRPVIVRAKCLPLRDSTIAQVGEWLRELAEHSLIVQYESGGRPYVFIPKFRQRTRKNAPKYPLPDNWQSIDGQSSDDRVAYADAYSDSDSDSSNGAEPPAAQPPFIGLPLNDGGEYGITAEQVREFADLYRAVDVEAQLRAMRGWLIANPANRKTKSGVLRFVTRWLGQEQNKGARKGAPERNAAVPQGKPKGPSESPLEAAVAHARYLHHAGQIDEAERDRLISEAAAKHRRAA